MTEHFSPRLKSLMKMQIRKSKNLPKKERELISLKDRSSCNSLNRLLFQCFHLLFFPPLLSTRLYNSLAELLSRIDVSYRQPAGLGMGPSKREPSPPLSIYPDFTTRYRKPPGKLAQLPSSISYSKKRRACTNANRDPRPTHRVTGEIIHLANTPR